MTSIIYLTRTILCFRLVLGVNEMAKNTRNKKPPAKLDPAKGSTSPSKTTEKEVNNEEVKVCPT